MTRPLIRTVFALVIAAGGTLGLMPLGTAAEKTTAADVSTKTSEALDTLKTYSLEKKDEAVAYGRQLLKDSDAAVTELQAKASKASGEAKARFDKEMTALKAQRTAAAAKLDEMGKRSGAAWNEAKQGFAEAYKELQHAYDKAARQLK